MLAMTFGIIIGIALGASNHVFYKDLWTKAVTTVRTYFNKDRP